jgi:hypothetical protein
MSDEQDSEQGRMPINPDTIYGANISVTPHFIEIFAQDMNGEEVVVTFSPYAGIKFTTSDCYRMPPPPDDWLCELGPIREMPNSTWLNELKDQLKLSDFDSDFLEGSKHFIFATQDVVMEIISPDWTVTKVNAPRQTQGKP